MSVERVEKAIEEIRAGRMVILVDDEDRENEGDLCLAAEKVTPEAINFMARYGRGLICLTLTEKRCDELDLPCMAPRNTSPLGTAFTVSIEAATGVSTGISAADRARTIRAAIADGAGPDDLVRPGHVFPLRSRSGGGLVRTGQTEGSVDLARLSGLKPAGVICEIMNDDGSMARRPDLEVFAEEHDLQICTVADIVDYRLQRERLIQRVAEAELQLGELGAFRVLAYRSNVDEEIHLAFVRGAWNPDDPVLVRVQNRDLMVDMIGAARRDGAEPSFRRALARVAAEGSGVVVYLRRGLEDFGEAVLQRITGEASSGRYLDEGGERVVRPDLREYGIGAQVLRDLGVRRLRLMSDAPARIVGIEGFGMEMVEQVSLFEPPAASSPDAIEAKVTYISKISGAD